MSLVLENITFTYPNSHHGVNDVSFHINTGELVAVIGPSGSGKSTLLKLVAGLSHGYTGKIILNDEDLLNKPVHKRNIGVVFQNYALFPHMNVIDNVAYGLKIRGESKKSRRDKASELLKIMELEAYAGVNINRLSGGQQQRVALARALAINPNALLLDEPLAALDASIRGHLRDQIRSLQQHFKATTLLVTHDQEEALTMADKVAVLKDSRLIQLAPPKEIYEFPSSKDVAEFVGLSTILPATVSAHNEVDLGFVKLSTDTGGRAVGQSLFVLFRPEHWIVDPPKEMKNIIDGNIGAVRYLGAIYRYDFTVAGCAVPMLVESVKIASKTIGINPEDIRLLDC